MTTDAFTEAARTMGVDPNEVRASVGNALVHRFKIGMSDEEVLMWLWHAGAIYGRDHLAQKEVAELADDDEPNWANEWIQSTSSPLAEHDDQQDPTDAEVDAAAQAIVDECTREQQPLVDDTLDFYRGMARIALTAARRAVA